MIVATAALRSKDRERLLNRQDVCAVIESPALSQLGHIQSIEALHFLMRGWFTGQRTWVVYYAH